MAPTTEIRIHLEELACRVSGLDSIRIEHHWAGIMGLVENRHPAVDDLLAAPPMDSRTETLAGFGGWGVTLAPFTAREVAKRF